ncbi:MULTISPECIES: hypothetical protein [Streptomyces]|nr:MULTISPECIES: hypothetical protein [unclassified Streptomyces]
MTFTQPARKRGLAVDVLGLIIGVVVLAASAHGGRAHGLGVKDHERRVL